MQLCMHVPQESMTFKFCFITMSGLTCDSPDLAFKESSYKTSHMCSQTDPNEVKRLQFTSLFLSKQFNPNYVEFKKNNKTPFRQNILVVLLTWSWLMTTEISRATSL